MPPLITKWQGVLREVVRRHKKGRPILIANAVGRIASEHLKRAFDGEWDCRPSRLNAVRTKSRIRNYLPNQASSGRITRCNKTWPGRGTDIALRRCRARGRWVLHCDSRLGGAHDAARIDSGNFMAVRPSGDPGRQPCHICVARRRNLHARLLGPQACGRLFTMKPRGQGLVSRYSGAAVVNLAQCARRKNAMRYPQKPA